MDEDEVQFQIKRHLEEENKLPNVPDQVYSHSNTEGELVRSVLTEYITHNLPADYFVEGIQQVIFIHFDISVLKYVYKSNRQFPI